MICMIIVQFCHVFFTIHFQWEMTGKLIIVNWCLWVLVYEGSHKEAELGDCTPQFAWENSDMYLISSVIINSLPFHILKSVLVKSLGHGIIGLILYLSMVISRQSWNFLYTKNKCNNKPKALLNYPRTFLSLFLSSFYL